MTTPADIIAKGLLDLPEDPCDCPDCRLLYARSLIAALDAAGYQIVPKADRPPVCPECGSDNPRIAGGRRTEPCPDPWHGGAE